ncbi:NUDIX domain, partial [Pristimantis euphronides]
SLREKIKSLLGKYDVGSRYTHFPLPKASILLPLLIRRGKPHLLLTVRSMQLNTMPGQVCFPGGRQEPSDKDDIQTALRETQEEIGLRPEQVHIVGKLVPHIPKSPSFLVTPIVGLVDDTFQPTPNPEEVTDVFLAPLEFFMSSEHYTPVKVDVPPFGIRTVHQFLYKDEDTNKEFNVWGMTAHCAVMLSAIILERKPSFAPNFSLENIIKWQEKYLQTVYNKTKL